MNTLIVIIGPTGIGKTKVAIEVAEHFNIPIINADSRQMYAEIPIGTAAPTKEQQTRVKHFFVGNLHISDYYNASMFEADVMALLNDMFQENSPDLNILSAVFNCKIIKQWIESEIITGKVQRHTGKKHLPFSFLGLRKDIGNDFPRHSVIAARILEYTINKFIPLERKRF